MARRPILEVPVNDAAFQALFEKMSEYQELLEGLGDKWKEQDSSVAGVAATMVMVTAALEAQREMLAEQTEELKAAAQAARDRAEAERAAAKVEEDAAKKKRQDLEAAKRYGRELLDMGKEMAKWSIFTLGAGVIGGAASLWGLDQAANWVGDQRRAAMGFGVSIAQRQALHARFSRDFDVDPALEGIANAQMDPRKASIFAALGLNPNGEDPAALTLDAALAVRRLLANVPQRSQLAYANALGIDQIFSADSIRRIMGEPAGDLQRRVSQYKQDVPGLRLADDAAQKWQDLLSSLEIKTLQVVDPLVTKLAGMEPDLEVIISKFSELALQVLDRIDFKALGDGLDAFTRYITSAQFQADFKAVVDDVSALAKHLGDFLRMIGWLPETSPDRITANKVGRAVSDTGIGVNPVLTNIMAHGATKWLLDEARKHIGGQSVAEATTANAAAILNGAPILHSEDSMQAVNTVAAPGSSGALTSTQKYGWGQAGIDTRNQDAIKFFMGKGWSLDVAAGMAGYLASEGADSPNPTGSNDHGEAFGAGQWHRDRQLLFRQLYGHDIQNSTLQEQWGFMDWEIRHEANLAKLLRKLLHGESAREAGGDIAVMFGRGANPAKDYISHGAAAARARAQVKVDITVNNHSGQSLPVVANQMSPAS